MPIDDPLWPDFLEFWAISTHKRSKGDAWKAYRGARKTATKEEIHDGYRRYGIEVAHREPEKRLYPASWLRAWGWLDEADSEVSAPRHTASEQRLHLARGNLVRAALGK